MPEVQLFRHGKLIKMNSFFKELFSYSYDCNQNLSAIFLEQADKTSEKSVKLFSHLLNAHQIWNNRIDFIERPFAVWEEHPFQSFQKLNQVNFDHTISLLDRFELDEKIIYKNSKNETFSNSVRDILFHIINHSTYHRAQIATEFKQSLIEPMSSDYIFYKR